MIDVCHSYRCSLWANANLSAATIVLICGDGILQRWNERREQRFVGRIPLSNPLPQPDNEYGALSLAFENFLDQIDLHFFRLRQQQGPACIRSEIAETTAHRE